MFLAAQVVSKSRQRGDLGGMVGKEVEYHRGEVTAAYRNSLGKQRRKSRRVMSLRT